MLRETDAILEERSYKKYAIRSFYSDNGKMIFVLLIEVIANYVVINSINVKKTCFKGIFIRVFYNCRSGFHYCSDNVLQFLI